MSLSVDVNTLQGYWHYGTPLTATLTWKMDGTCSDKGGWHGQSTYNHDGQSFTYRYNGTYSSGCADVTGNIGGPVSFPGTQEYAYIYSHRSINRRHLTFER